MKWVNRIGILLEFLSFWFAAPEILGDKRLKALERMIEDALDVLRLLILLSLLLPLPIPLAFTLLRGTVVGDITFTY